MVLRPILVYTKEDLITKPTQFILRQKIKSAEQAIVKHIGKRHMVLLKRNIFSVELFSHRESTHERIYIVNFYL